MKVLLLLLPLLLPYTPVFAATLKAVDTYGSRQVTLNQIFAAARSEIERFGEAVAQGDHEAARPR